MGLGDSLRVATSKRRGLASRLTLAFVELITRRLILDGQVGDLLLQAGHGGAQV